MKALVLSGGGSKGAYQVGALLYLLGLKDIKYDILCGVSVGAINASYLSQFKNEDNNKASIQLANLWRNLRTSNVHKRWFPFGRLHGLVESSFYNSVPLRSVIESNYNPEMTNQSGKTLLVGSVSLNTGKYRLFNNLENMVDAILASSSFPAFLAPSYIDDQWWTDGGVRNITPVEAAINSGATEIHIVMTSPEGSTIKNYTKKPSAIDIAMRSIEIMTDEIIENDIKLMHLYNNLAGKSGYEDRKYIEIKIIRPKEALQINSLKFQKDKIAKLIKTGFQDATKSSI